MRKKIILILLMTMVLVLPHTPLHAKGEKITVNVLGGISSQGTVLGIGSGFRDYYKYRLALDINATLITVLDPEYYGFLLDSSLGFMVLQDYYISALGFNIIPQVGIYAEILTPGGWNFQQENVTKVGLTFQLDLSLLLNSKLGFSIKPKIQIQVTQAGLRYDSFYTMLSVLR